jgi:hydroxyethylthiazole kinase-like uncharacterized protein yjeF
VSVHICLIGNAAQYSTDAKQSLERAQNSAVTWIHADELAQTQLKHYDLVIDGLFGIGLNRPLERSLGNLILFVNQESLLNQIPVLALDVPSGLNADTGQIIGEHGVAIRASDTITFIGNKPGLHTAKAKDYAGRISVASLGIENTLYPETKQFLLTADALYGSLPQRSQDSNKGSFGDVLIVGGNDGMSGAPILSARAALYCGAGRVHIGFLSKGLLIDSLHPEIMCREAEQSNFQSAAIVIGPGLSTQIESANLLFKALESDAHLVLDADALNLIANNQNLQSIVVKRREKKRNTILTPHPLEAARLLNCTVVDVQANRCNAALRLAKEFEATIILKGAGSIITNGSTLYINSSGNASLATAGTGDVLAGVCGALLAQGLTEIDAARMACFIHGASVDYLIAKGIGPVGITASEIIPAIRFCLNQLAEKTKVAH